MTVALKLAPVVRFRADDSFDEDKRIVEILESDRVRQDTRKD